MGEPLIDRTKYRYQSTRVVDPKTGKVKHSTGNGDAVARAMLGLTHDDLIKVAKTNDIWDKVSKFKDAVNSGMFRMNVGNILRAMVRKGTEVTIGEHLIKKLDQREPVIKEPPAAEKKAPEPKKVRSKKAA